MRWLERIYTKMCRQRISILFNDIYIYRERERQRERETERESWYTSCRMKNKTCHWVEDAFCSLSTWFLVVLERFILYRVIQLRKGKHWFNSCNWSDYWLSCFGLSLYNNREGLENVIRFIQPSLWRSSEWSSPVYWIPHD